MEIVQPLIDNGILDKVLDEKGNSIENWRNKGWINGIGDFQPGEGYILLASGNGTLTINDFQSKSSYIYAERFETNNFNVSYEGNGIDHMNINILDLSGAGFQVGDELAAYDGDICVGAIKLTELDFTNNTVSIPASACEVNSTNGFICGRPIQLRAWKSEKDTETKIGAITVEGEFAFNKYSSVFIQLQKSDIISSNTEIDLLNTLIYPNPATNMVNVSFYELPKQGTEIVLMNTSGKTVLRQVVEEKNERLDIQHLSSGVYFIQTTYNNVFKVQKLIKR
jgi:hypothetical protein